ncbi:MAG: hypothetical protein JO023_15050, partial [Chloroflexi bacterium]|nr:hypothetical protein [Chloroflexota bacterium]
MAAGAYRHVLLELVTRSGAIRWPGVPRLGRWAIVCLMAAAWLLPYPAHADGQELIVDDGDASVTHTGNWAASTTTPGFYGAGYLFRVAGTGAYSVTWPFPANGAAGRYQVYARWTSGPNRASNASFQVTSSGGS